MRYVFDIDGTICSDTQGEYEKAEPILNRIKIINNLYKEGNTIIFYTARGMGSNNNDGKKASNKYYTLTYNQLKKWGIKYHELYVGMKPSGDIYIDDKGLKDEEFFRD